MINLKQLLVFVQAKDNAIADTYFGDIHLRRKWCALFVIVSDNVKCSPVKQRDLFLFITRSVPFFCGWIRNSRNN